VLDYAWRVWALPLVATALLRCSVNDENMMLKLTLILSSSLALASTECCSRLKHEHCSILHSHDDWSVSRGELYDRRSDDPGLIARVVELMCPRLDGSDVVHPLRKLLGAGVSGRRALDRTVAQHR